METVSTFSSAFVLADSLILEVAIDGAMFGDELNYCNTEDSHVYIGHLKVVAVDAVSLHTNFISSIEFQILHTRLSLQVP